MARVRFMRKFVNKFTAAAVIKVTLHILRYMQCFPYTWSCKGEDKRYSGHLPIGGSASSTRQEVYDLAGIPGSFTENKKFFKIPILTFLLLSHWELFLITQSSLFYYGSLTFSTAVVTINLMTAANVVGAFLILVYLRRKNEEMVKFLLELHRLIAICGTRRMWRPLKDKIFVTKLIVFLASISTLLTIDSFDEELVEFDSSILTLTSSKVLIRFSEKICSLLAITVITVVGIYFYALSSIIGSIYGALNRFSQDIQTIPLEILEQKHGFHLQDFALNAVKEPTKKKKRTCCCSAISRRSKTDTLQSNDEWAHKLEASVQTLTDSKNQRGKFEQATFTDFMEDIEEKLFIISDFQGRFNNFFTIPLVWMCCMASLSTISGTFFITANIQQWSMQAIVSFGDFWNIVFLCLAPERYTKEMADLLVQARALTFVLRGTKTARKAASVVDMVQSSSEGYNLSRFVSLSRGALVAICSQLITYTIILLQFQLGEISQLKRASNQTEIH